MAEQELDLLQIPAVVPGQPLAGTAQDMGAEAFDPDCFDDCSTTDQTVVFRIIVFRLSGVLPFMCEAIDKELTSSSVSDDNRNNTTGPSSLCVRVGFPFMGTSAPFSNPYDKPYKSVAEQIALLLSRGMTIAGIPAATTYLERMGYYRLSGYWYPFRKSHIHRHGVMGRNAVRQPQKS